ncbi:MULTISPECIES: sugar O-acetyltransferase [unclassified Enterococcus]|uniref:sugar O-acetyltransferase n=1 Tax=unclassified Enterococcus TaxID=2608891 RepID=UPI001553043C|nr:MULTISPECIES: sugar O-acetyltransferase [unclassified Enterococcus]MBS7577639.1 sugar O-acetyltransferase [Enterococcus sp. MMGLQ5-2]MBS7584167.1 sugar O-acetyltransferase [Enterococcus sp. MMGLQ5-1]NPD12025.1 sugar O-acetyltransferase [Enterococcus sp. MMGLQ5-1]NPD37472.1 sugar O-acetyltransferase [Enterococcus sp. MMGLQ5-2]
MVNNQHNGKLYLPNDEDLVKEQNLWLDRLYDFNHTRASQNEKRQDILEQLLAEIGENCYIEPPFYANWGGHHLHLGHRVYANFNLTCVDDTHIYIGDDTMIGPNVTLATAGHPISPNQRLEKYQFNQAITIGKNCWLGAGVIVLPGVSIGDHSIIGAGSVVTRDIPANKVAFGNPCRVVRDISDSD